ncbi:MAG: SPFH domain-containing protein [Dermatophilaceae bacterium]
MATITRYPFIAHLRSTTTMHVHHLAGGTTRHSGPGASFWFRPMAAAISEVPVDDRAQSVLVPVRSADLQQFTAAGVVTYRFSDPVLAATRVDFAIDVAHGGWLRTPLETVGGMIQGAAAAAVTATLTGLDLRAALATPTAELAAQVSSALAADERLAEVGVQVVGARFGLLRPEPDVERALQTPARETIQQDADRATFERRALAVEREAAIGQNELANRIDLEARRERLVVQQGANDRREAEERAAAEAVAVRAEAERTTALAEARAAAQRVTGAAEAEAERARLEAYAEVPAAVLLAVAAREAAANLPQVDQLVLTPDLVSGVLARLAGAPEGGRS